MKLKELLDDPGFENWAKRNNEADYLKWEAWRAENPAYATLMDEAKLMLTGIEFIKTQVSEQEKQAELENLLRRLGLSKEPAVMRSVRRRRWLVVAAAVLVLLLAAGWWVFNPSAEPAWITVTTEYGELRSLELPDGSVTTMNSNSELRFPKNWKAGQARVVELYGEAFFEVEHKKGKEAFIVIAAGLKAEVLGTRFNVFARRDKPVVSLAEGSIRLTEIQTGTTALLKPGETAQFDEEEKAFNIDRGKIAEQTSWKNYRWVFDNTPISTVFQRIEDEFGLSYRAKNKQRLNRTVSGQVSTNRLSVLLRALEALLDVKIKEEDGVLKIN